MRRWIFCSAAALCATTSHADITTINKTSLDLPKLEIRQGRGNCADMTNKVYPAAPAAKDFLRTWPNTGTNKDSICWSHTERAGQMVEWVLCLNDGECQITQ
jgi:hypothetical protein